MNNLKKKLSLFVVMFAAMLVFSLAPATNADAATKKTHSYSGASYVVNQGKSLQLPTGAGYTYSSDNTKIATVDANGKVVGKKGGCVIITAKSASGYSRTFEVGVKSKTYYPNIYGKYKVGKDIPAGQYVVIHDPLVKSTNNFTYWALYKNKNGTFMRNDGFSYTSIVTLKKGQYFDFNGGYAVPIKKVNKTVFSLKNLNKYGPKEGTTVKVGYGFPAGTYKFTLAKGMSYGSINVATKDRGLNSNYKYVKRCYVSKSAKTVTITVKKGQYLEISGCTIKKK